MATTSFATRLKRARERAGFTPEQLAEAAGLEHTAVYRIEAKAAPDPRLSTVVRISEALEISLDELVGRKVPNKSVNGSCGVAAFVRKALAKVEEG
ncbi:MAG: helix-turn-helix transcriptional regulator [Candidatus Aquilonibacter sp.]